MTDRKDHVMNSKSPWKLLALLCCALTLLMAVPIALLPTPLFLVPAVLFLLGSLIGLALWSTWQATRQGGDGAALSQVNRQLHKERNAVLYDDNFGLYQEWYLELRLS